MNLYSYFEVVTMIKAKVSFNSEFDALLSRYRGSLLGKRGDKAFYKTKELAQFQVKYEALVNHILDEYSFEKAPKWINAAAFYPDIETLRIMKCETYSQRKVKFKEDEVSQAEKNFLSFEAMGECEQAGWPRYRLELEEKNFDIDYYYRLPVKKTCHYAVYADKRVEEISCPKYTFFNNDPYIEEVNKKTKFVPKIRTNHKERYRYQMQEAGTWHGYRFSIRDGVLNSYSEPLWRKVIVERF